MQGHQPKAELLVRQAWQLLRAGGSFSSTRGLGLPARVSQVQGVGGRVLAAGDGWLGGAVRGDKGKGS